MRPSLNSPITRAQVERVCRMYNNNGDAATALSMTRSGFRRLCDRLGIETPARRNSRRKRAAQAA